MSLDSGTKVGDYEIVREIARGVGGMGRVYLAERRGVAGFRHLCVLKEVRAEVLQNRQQAKEWFRHEARIDGLLVHENLVRAFDFIEMDEQMLLVLEYVDGITLSEASRASQRLSRDFCGLIVARVADGLDFAHNLVDPDTGLALGLVHRDISPSNVLISRSGEVKLTDFGVSRSSARETKSVVGEYRGKFGYMSPEQITHARGTGPQPDARSDIFSLGVVLHEAVSGRRLFVGSPERQMDSIVHGEIPELRMSENDPHLESIVARALERDVNRRYSTSREFADDLYLWLSSRGRGAGIQRELGRWITDVIGPDMHERPTDPPGPIQPRGPAQAANVLELISEIERDFGMDSPRVKREPGRVGQLALGPVVAKTRSGLLHAALHVDLGLRRLVHLVHPEIWDEEAPRLYFVRVLQSLSSTEFVGSRNLLDIIDSPVPAVVFDEALGVPVADCRPQANRRLSLVAQVVRELSSAHSLGIVHGAIGPHGVLWNCNSDRASLIDFGTLGGVIEGCDSQELQFLAPEQLGGELPSAGSDVYSVAVLAHYCLVGSTPFRGDSAQVGRSKLVYGAPRVDDLGFPGSANLRAALIASMHRDPGLRPSLGELESAVFECIPGDVSSELSSNTRLPAAIHSEAERTWWWQRVRRALAGR
ncbi:MAG: protein kinase [Deltaproteobacteria bacterium]|nr:protein kinase [Deltaproteobacteria bacterium]